MQSINGEYYDHFIVQNCQAILNFSSSAVRELITTKFFHKMSLGYAAEFSPASAIMSFWLFCEVMLIMLMGMLKETHQLCTALLGELVSLGK